MYSIGKQPSTILALWYLLWALEARLRGGLSHKNLGHLTFISHKSRIKTCEKWQEHFSRDFASRGLARRIILYSRKTPSRRCEINLYKKKCLGQVRSRLFDRLKDPLSTYYRFQINCTFITKSEIFYTDDVKNLGERYKISPKINVGINRSLGRRTLLTSLIKSDHGRRRQKRSSWWAIYLAPARWITH